jgi:hypothetical protein
MYYGKLFIYDTADDDNRKQAEGRFSENAGILALPCASADELEAGLDRLVAKRAVFDRVLVQTHGEPGMIRFGDDAHPDRLYWSYFGSAIKNKGYEALFPLFTKIYFDGCNVGTGQKGDDFLEAVGGTLLRKAGGITMAFENAGYAPSAWIPFIGGHTLHLNDLSAKNFYFAPGGLRVKHSIDDDPNGKLNVGNKI